MTAPLPRTCRRRRWTGLALPCLLGLAATAPARAQDPSGAVPSAAAEAASARIQTLSHVDRAGRWRTVDQTDQGSVFRIGPDGLPVEDVLRAGDALGPGDRIRTRSARVEVLLSDGSRLNIAEDSELTLDSPGQGGAWERLVQEAGSVYYRMRNALTVEHGTVETVVEGTRFLVEVLPGQDAVQVKVEEGVVSVRRAGQEPVRLTRNRTAASTPDRPTETPTRWSPSRLEMARTWPLGRPRLVLGVTATGQLLSGLADGGAAGERPLDGGGGLRLTLGVHLPADLRLELDSGLTASGTGSLRMPAGVGLGWDPGPVQLGGSLAVAFEDRTLLCDGEQQLLHLGGTGWVRADLPLSRRVALRGELRAGYLGDVLVEPSVGVGVGL